MAVATGRRSRSIVAGVAWIVAGQGVTTGVGLLSNAILARALGPTGTGVLAVTLLIPTFLALVAGGGLASANVYFVGRGELTPSAVAWNSVFVAVVGSACSVVIITLAAVTGVLWTAFPGVSPGLLLLAMAVLPVLVLRQSTAAILMGLNRMSQTSRLEMAQAAGYLASVCLLVVFLGIGVIGALTAYLIAISLALFGALAWLRRSRTIVLRPIGTTKLGHVLRYGYRSSAGLIVQFFTYRLDLVLVNLWVSAAFAGQYAIAARISEMMWLLPAAVGAVVFSASAASTPGDMNRVVPRAFWVTIAIGVAAAVAIVAVGPVVIPFIFSEAFDGAYGPLVILLPGTVLLGSSSVLANDLAGRGHPGLVSVAALVTAVGTVTLDVLLIPRFGVNGAALASTISYSLYAALIVVTYLRVSAIGRGFLLMPTAARIS